METKIEVEEQDLIDMLAGWEEGTAYKGEYLTKKHGDLEEIARLKEKYKI